MSKNIKSGCIRFDDIDMYYVAFGSGDKNLIIIPGLSDGLSTVKGKALFLEKPYRIFEKQYRVYIFSRKNNMSEGYSMYEMANDQVKALKALGIDKTSVMGISQGGMIAQCLAINFPEVVDKLIIGVSTPCINDLIRMRINEWVKLAEERNHKQLMISTAENSYSSEYLKKMRKLYPLIGLIGKPKNYDRFFINAKAILNFNVLDELKNINAPTLILGGGKDQIVGVDGSYLLKEKIKDSIIYIYPEFGHAAFEEAKDFNKRVLDFLNND